MGCCTTRAGCRTCPARAAGAGFLAGSEPNVHVVYVVNLQQQGGGAAARGHHAADGASTAAPAPPPPARRRACLIRVPSPLLFEWPAQPGADEFLIRYSIGTNHRAAHFGSSSSRIVWLAAAAIIQLQQFSKSDKPANQNFLFPRA